MCIGKHPRGLAARVGYSLFWLCMPVASIAVYLLGGEVLRRVVLHVAGIHIPLAVAAGLFALLTVLAVLVFSYADYRHYYGKDGDR